MIFLLLMSLAGFSLFARRILDVPSAITPLLITSTISLLLFRGAFVGNIALSAQCLFYIGLALFVFSLYQSRQNAKQLFDNNKPLLVFILLALLLFFGLYHVFFIKWDEFSYWGLVSKYIYSHHQLLPADVPVCCKDYPPICALFHYYVYSALGTFEESYALFAQGLLLLAALMSTLLISPLRKGVVALTIVLITVLVFNKSALHTMYVDVTAACFFAAILVSYYLMEHRYKALMLLPAIVMLPLIKQVGLLFAVLAFIFIMLDQIIECFFQGKSAIKPLLLSLVLIFAGLFSVHSLWHNHLQKQGIQKTFKTKTITARKLLSTIVSPNEAKNKAVLKQFRHALLFKGKSVNQLHVPVVIILLLIAFAFFRCYQNENSKRARLRLLLLFSVLFLGFIVYALGLLSLYLFTFQYMAGNVVLFSFGRYMALYLIAFSLPAIILLVKHGLNLPEQKLTQVSMAASVIVCALLLFSHRHGLNERRQITHKMGQEIQQHGIVKKNKKIYIIHQGDWGIAYIMMAYEIFPMHANSACVSLDKASTHINSIHCDLTKKQFFSKLKRYDYLALSHIDNYFIQHYGELIKSPLDKNKMYLYKIVKTKQGLRFDSMPKVTQNKE